MSHTCRINWGPREDGPPRQYTGIDERNNHYAIVRSRTSEGQDSWRVYVNTNFAGEKATVSAAKDFAVAQGILIIPEESKPSRFKGQEVFCMRHGIKAEITEVNSDQTLIKVRYIEPITADVTFPNGNELSHTTVALDNTRTTINWCPALSYIALTDKATQQEEELRTILEKFAPGLSKTVNTPTTLISWLTILSKARNGVRLYELVDAAREAIAYDKWMQAVNRVILPSVVFRRHDAIQAFRSGVGAFEYARRQNN